MFARKNSVRSLIGFPDTTEVTAKTLKSGQTVMVNGTNAFTIPPLSGFAVISVEKGEKGESLLVGKSGVGATARTVLAAFGSEEAAANGHRVLMKGFGSGLSAGRMSPWIKYPIILAGLWIGLGVLASGVAGGMAAVAQTSGADTANSLVAMQDPTPLPFAPGTSASSGQSLEDMANGNYRFAPQIAMPQIQAPQLECAPLSN